MATDVSIHVKAIDDASPTLQKVGKEASNLSKAASGPSALSKELTGLGRTAVAVALGMGGLNIAVTGLKAGLEGTIQAAAADAASIARLQAAVNATGASYKNYEKSLDGVIKKGQELAFSDEQTRSGLSILIAQTDSVAEATRRYAIAQDLARGANIDVVTASRLLGKITEDNVTALQRYGISVKNGATETEALAAVQQKFAGQAKAYADSTAGQFDRTSDAIHEAGESIGRILLPAVAAAATGAREAADQANVLATAFDNVSDKGSIFKDIALGVGLLAAAIATIRIAEFASQIQQLIGLQVALSRGMSSSAIATGLLGKALSNPVVAVGLLTVAVVGLDLAVRHFTGGGLIDYLTGATEAHNRAAAAAKSQGDAEENLARLSKLGVTGANAGTLALADLRERLRVAQELQKVEEATARAKLQPNLRDQSADRITQIRPDIGVPILKSQQVLDAATEQAAKNLRTLMDNGAISVRQFRDEASKPIFGDRFKSDIEAIDKALGDVAGSAAATADALISAGKEAQSAFSGATSDLAALFDQLDPVTQRLKLQKDSLERLKTTMGDAFGPDNQARLDEISRRFSIATSKADELKDHAALVSANIQSEFGDSLTDAAAKTNELSAAILQIPAEKRIDVLMNLPDIEINRLLRFLQLIHQLGTQYIDVALRIATETPQQATPNRFSRGNFGEVDTAKQKADAVVQALEDINFERIKNEALGTNAALGPLGTQIDKTGGAAKDALTPLSAVEDGFISLSEALQLGLSDAQVVALELAAATNEAAEADYRRRINLETLAAVFPGLTSQEVQFRLGLKEIADHLQATGETIQQFILDTSTAALNGFKSAFDAIFNKPTKEGAALQLQLDEAKRRKLLAPGASDAAQKRMDAEIKRIQDLINLRSNAQDIEKDRAALADKTALSDADQVKQAELLTAAIADSSQKVADNTGIVYLQTLANIGLKDRTLDTTTAIANLGDAAVNATAQLNTPPPSQLSLADALKALAALPDHGQSLLPASFATGIANVPRDMTARIHRGERIIPAGQVGESGQPINITSYITVEGDATQKTVDMIKKAVRDESEAALRRASFRGSYVTSGAYTPQ